MRSAQNPALLKALAGELKARRAVLKISQEELAHRSELNRTFIGKIEVAANQPSISAFFCIASGLGISPSELIEGVTVRYLQELKLKTPRRKT